MEGDILESMSFPTFYLAEAEKREVLKTEKEVLEGIMQFVLASTF